MTGFGWRTLAMAAPGDGAAPQSPAFMVVWLLLMVGVFYFILIRPQQRREREKRNLLSAIKSGDRVIFGGGILGMVTNVKDKTFTVKIADNVKIEVARYAVSQVLEKGDAPGTEGT